MMRSRSSRRASGHDDDAGNGDAPTILETLLDSVTDLVARSAMIRLRNGTRRLVTWSLRQAMLGWTTAAILTVGLVLLLVAGVKGLEAAGCPSWVAYLSAGAAAVIAALGLMRGLLVPRDDEDDDFL
jgi:hypothetical protein